MIRYRVSIESPAATEMEAAWPRIHRKSPLNAARWYNRLLIELAGLERFPNRCALAPETRHFKDEIRELLFGRGLKRCRALFLVRSQTVHILHFRHWARASMRKRDVRLQPLT